MVELWFQASGSDWGSLVNVYATHRRRPQDNALALGTFASLSARQVCEAQDRACWVRGLHRWPPGKTGGSDLQVTASPQGWLHAVLEAVSKLPEGD